MNISHRDGNNDDKKRNLVILSMSVLGKMVRFDKKDEFSLKKSIFDEIVVKASVYLV